MGGSDHRERAARATVFEIAHARSGRPYVDELGIGIEQRHQRGGIGRAPIDAPLGAIPLESLNEGITQNGLRQGLLGQAGRD